MVFIIGFFITLALYICYATCKKKTQFNQIQADGLKDSSKSNTSVISILTGLPVQTRHSDGRMTGAGMQQMTWCNKILDDMGKRKCMNIDIMGKKRSITKKQVEEHLKVI